MLCTCVGAKPLLQVAGDNTATTKKSSIMKLKIAITFIFFLVYGSQADAQSPTFKDTVSAYFENVKYQTRKNIKVWQKDIYGPILLVNLFNRTAYANYPDSAGVLKKEGDIYVGTLPRNVLVANAPIYWNGRTWAMILIQFLPSEDHNRNNLITHELFHVAQQSLGFTKVNERQNNHLDLRDGRIYLRLELAALREAAISRNSRKRKTHFKNALLFRKKRHELFPGSDTSENIVELNEGLAEYTGERLSGRSRKEAYKHFASKINSYILSPSYVRTFPYQTIPVYGYFLNKKRKYWNQNIRSQTNLTSYISDQLNVAIKPDALLSIKKLFPLYKGDAIVMEETKRETDRLKLVAEYKTRFFEQPTLEITFEKRQMSFDTRNLVALGDKGVVYSTLTVNDNWGTLVIEKGGGLISPTQNKILISAPVQINDTEITGEGWTLKLKKGYTLTKDEKTRNYKVIKS